MTNISELNISTDEIMQSAPSEINLMNQVFEDLRGNKPKALDSHGLADLQPHGRLSSGPEMQRSPSGDSPVVDVPSTTDCMLQVFSDLRTNQPKALETHELAALPLIRRCNSMTNMSIFCRHLSSLPKSCSTSRWMHCPMTHRRWRIQPPLQTSHLQDQLRYSTRVRHFVSILYRWIPHP